MIPFNVLLWLQSELSLSAPLSAHRFTIHKRTIHHLWLEQRLVQTSFGIDFIIENQAVDAVCAVISTEENYVNSANEQPHKLYVPYTCARHVAFVQLQMLFQSG